jgi:G:T-mismatch repair DNA endonuclease (very short patch repair protein)
LSGHGVPQLVAADVQAGFWPMHKMGYRFRLHRLDLLGNPDIVLPKYTWPSLYFPFF